MSDYKRLIKKALEDYSETFVVTEKENGDYEVTCRGNKEFTISYHTDLERWTIQTYKFIPLELIGEIQYYLESHLYDDED